MEGNKPEIKEKLEMRDREKLVNFALFGVFGLSGVFCGAVHDFFWE